VRESVFNMLVNHVDLGGVSVLDLFAGSGALGIEALSRGAGRATFVDHDRAAVAAIRTNLTACGFEDRAEVVEGRVDGHLRELAQGGRGPVDVAFADPPYAHEGWPDLLGRLPARLVVAESDREIDLPAGWRTVRARRYGSTVVTIAVAEEPA
jgi:16S rRNA (guanine(966)-N(2))-methyltransferase RsmD